MATLASRIGDFATRIGQVMKTKAALAGAVFTGPISATAINGTPIGSTTPSTGAFTSATATGSITAYSGTTYPIRISALSVGAANMGIGRNALNPATSGNFNVAFGHDALSSLGAAGLNTAFGDSVGTSLTTGGSNSLFGSQTGFFLTTGSSNTIFGSGSGQGITTGIGNTIFGYFAGTAAMNYNVVLADGSGTVRYRWDGSDHLLPGHATTASAANAFLDSTTGALRRSTSSAKYKRDVEPIDPAFADRALQLRAVWYRSLAPSDNPDWGWWGLIAEEVAKIDPRLVHYAYQDDQFEEVEASPAQPERYATFDEHGAIVEPAMAARPAAMERRVRDGERMRPDGVQYERLSVLLLSIVQRQDARIAALEARLP